VLEHQILSHLVHFQSFSSGKTTLLHQKSQKIQYYVTILTKPTKAFWHLLL